MTAEEADDRVGAARNGATAMDRLEEALQRGVPIAELLAAQTARHARDGAALDAWTELAL